MICDFDVSSPSRSFDFEVTDVLFLVFIKGEELVETLPLQYVSPMLEFGNSCLDLLGLVWRLGKLFYFSFGVLWKKS